MWQEKIEDIVSNPLVNRRHWLKFHYLICDQDMLEGYWSVAVLYCKQDTLVNDES